MPYITDHHILASKIIEFAHCVRDKDEQIGFYSPNISFTDSGSWLRSQEYYKYEIYMKTTEKMDCMTWKEGDIGTGKIAKEVRDAIKCTKNDNNLIDMHQQIHLDNIINNQNDYTKIDQAFYDLYRGSREEEVFDTLTGFFGKKYDIIAFLYFIKDSSCYLPIRSKNIDLGFKKLGIEYKTQGQCSWDNYIGYIKIVRNIQIALRALLSSGAEPTLLDAHSFVWIVSHDFYNWVPDTRTSEKINKEATDAAQTLEGSDSPEYRDRKVPFYVRDQRVVKSARRFANGICQLCEKPAPFKDDKGQPYLEVHHIDWISKGGIDRISNAVALCPNCHSKMHVVDDHADVDFLKEKAKKQGYIQ